MRKGLLRLIDRLCLMGAWLAALMIAGLFVLGLIELILRNLFGASLSISVEYMGYLVGLSLLLGAGWTLNQDGHIQITLLRDQLSPQAARAIDICASLFGLLASGYFAYALISYALQTLISGTQSYYPSATPLGIPQLALSLGPSLLTLAFLARLLHQAGEKEA